MRRTLTTLLTLSLLAAGCAAMREERIHQKENLLAAAGFKMKLADTPQALAQLQAMPQNRMIARSAPDGSLVYTYADLQGCKCLYKGHAPEYQQYRQLALAKQFAQDQVEAAEANEAASMDWGWWGPW